MRARRIAARAIVAVCLAGVVGCGPDARFQALLNVPPSLRHVYATDEAVRVNFYPNNSPAYHWQVVTSGDSVCDMGGYGADVETAAADCLTHANDARDVHYRP